MENVCGWILNDTVGITALIHLLLTVTASCSKWQSLEVGKNLFGGLLVNGVGCIAMSMAHEVAEGSVSKVDPNSCILRKKQR